MDFLGPNFDTHRSLKLNTGFSNFLTTFGRILSSDSLDEDGTFLFLLVFPFFFREITTLTELQVPTHVYTLCTHVFVPLLCTRKPKSKGGSCKLIFSKEQDVWVPQTPIYPVLYYKTNNGSLKLDDLWCLNMGSTG